MRSRRLIVLVLVLSALAIPAGALRAACVGKSCAANEAPARVPFCPLPSWMKDDVSAGFYDKRSPDVLGVSRRQGLSEGPDAPPWPSVAAGPDATNVPIVFSGRGVDRSASIPAGTQLDAVAPTIAAAIGLHRAHPTVRSGVAVPGVADGDRPALVVEVAISGIGSRDVEANMARWPTLVHLIRSTAGTMRGDTGSLPLDPAATLTTIGTGGLPSEHGITGAVIRNETDGRVVHAWGDGAPTSVIATLADDLDERWGAAKVGLVAPTIADRGLVGGTWYGNEGHDDLRIGRADPVPAVRFLLSHGYGSDATPDILGVVLDGHARAADHQLRGVLDAADAAAHGSAMVVVAGTGSTTDARGGLEPAIVQIEDEVSSGEPVVSGVAAGGLFLDQHVLAARRISGQTVVDAMLDTTDTDGGALVRDAFQGFAVSFARYC